MTSVEAQLRAALKAAAPFLPGMMCTSDVGSSASCKTFTPSGAMTHCQECMLTLVEEALRRTNET
jgi:hypothetical protein